MPSSSDLVLVGVGILVVGNDIGCIAGCIASRKVADSHRRIAAIRSSDFLTLIADRYGRMEWYRQTYGLCTAH